ncbi:hypothetical protein APICC_03779 [Apis cerana cerana]|uniref:Uncharacterized protein n=1 Tax=Apis cerana cerana TaxID=94128 RepID=A0A2A3EA24_APICC|nr:hypothetical protein APICC_03779 [Apis cerana cerana]
MVAVNEQKIARKHGISRFENSRGEQTVNQYREFLETGASYLLDFPLKKIVLWINGIVYKNMLEMLEEEFFKIKICVTIVMDCEIFEFRYCPLRSLIKLENSLRGYISEQHNTCERIIFGCNTLDNIEDVQKSGQNLLHCPYHRQNFTFFASATAKVLVAVLLFAHFADGLDIRGFTGGALR